MCLLKQSNVFLKLKLPILFYSVIKRSNRIEIKQEFIELNFSLLILKIKSKNSNTSWFQKDSSPLIYHSHIRNSLLRQYICLFLKNIFSKSNIFFFWLNFVVSFETIWTFFLYFLYILLQEIPNIYKTWGNSSVPSYTAHSPSKLLIYGQSCFMYPKLYLYQTTLKQTPGTITFFFINNSVHISKDYST